MWILRSSHCEMTLENSLNTGLEQTQMDSGKHVAEFQGIWTFDCV